jgi:predicted nucleic acid binding AN1-type Zn finger protein
MAFMQDTRIFSHPFERQESPKKKWSKCPKCNKDAIIHCHICQGMYCMDHRWPDEHECKKEGK